MRPTIRILEEALIGRILEEAKRVLATVGMEIRGPEMRRRLLEHGLPMDAAGVRVLFPRDVVDAALTSAPSSFVLYDRDGNPHADLGGDRVHFVPGSSGLKVLDHRTGEVRLAGTTDFVEYVRLADGMKHIAYLATAFSTNDDIEVVVADAWRLFLTLTNPKRPVVSGAFTEHGVERMVEMQQIFRRDRADLIARPMSIFTRAGPTRCPPRPARPRHGGEPRHRQPRRLHRPPRGPPRDRLQHDGRRMPGLRPGRRDVAPGR